jgi:periplasmic protein TonB
LPGTLLNLGPPRNPEKTVSEENSTSTYGVPRFGRPPMLMPDNFWSNLKQFLFERPVKVRGDVKSTLMPAQYGDGFWNNVSEYFTNRPVPKGTSDSRLSTGWVEGFGGFGTRIKEFFSPAKQAPLPFEVKPVRVKEIWTKDENFGWTQVISISLHVVLIGLIVVPLFTHVLPPPTEAMNKTDVLPLDISPYAAKLPSGTKPAGGGGGANDHTTTPVNRGKLPKFKWTQFTPPQVKIMNPAPKLPMDPSLLGPPDLRVSNIQAPTFGDPLANGVSDSLGHGNGTGIGSGSGGGLGPGEGGGTGGGAFRAGVNGVGMPSCIYCPDPQYSDEARKAKYQGVVVLMVIITLDGRATNIQVVKSPGLGLDEKAIEAVRQWKFRPAVGPGGKAVPSQVPIEVTFRLF